MTTHNHLEGNGRRSVRVPLIILGLGLGVAVAVVVGWSSHTLRAEPSAGALGPGKPGKPLPEAVLIKRVEEQLEAARAIKKWTDQDQQQFDFKLGPLTQASRGRLSRALAGLINNRALIIDHGYAPDSAPAIPLHSGRSAPAKRKP